MGGIRRTQFEAFLVAEKVDGEAESECELRGRDICSRNLSYVRNAHSFTRWEFFILLRNRPRAIKERMNRITIK
jgi:hypothetical protein